VSQFEGIAAELGCKRPQLAIAWAAKNPRVSSVITGASRLEQFGASTSVRRGDREADAAGDGRDRGDLGAACAVSPR